MSEREDEADVHERPQGAGDDARGAHLAHAPEHAALVLDGEKAGDEQGHEQRPPEGDLPAVLQVHVAHEHAGGRPAQGRADHERDAAPAGKGGSVLHGKRETKRRHLTLNDRPCCMRARGLTACQPPRPPSTVRACAPVLRANTRRRHRSTSDRLRRRCARTPASSARTGWP